LRDIPGREEITDLSTAFVHRRRRRDAADLPNLLGARKYHLEYRRGEILGDSISPRHRLITHRPRNRAPETSREEDRAAQRNRLEPASDHVRLPPWAENAVFTKRVLGLRFAPPQDGPGGHNGAVGNMPKSMPPCDNRLDDSVVSILIDQYRSVIFAGGGAGSLLRCDKVSVAAR